MNDLSWLLYLADVSGSLGGSFAVLCFLCAIVFVLTLFVGSVMKEEGDPDESAWASWRRWLISTTAIGSLAFVANAVIPSQDTVYAIAVSEMGEEVIQSETGGKAMKALDKWLDDQIGGDDE